MGRTSRSLSKTSQNGPEKDTTLLKTSKDARKKVTCHQCRQVKDIHIVAPCKVLKKKKRCPMKYCESCLRNRYGEEKKIVSLLDDWQCPRCRGICNCSQCRKKEGLEPTGILVRTARENGFLCVSELLNAKDFENIDNEKTVNVEASVSLKKAEVSKKESSKGIQDGGDDSRSSHDIKHNNNLEVKDKASSKSGKKRKFNIEVQNVEPEIQLPIGTCLMTVAGIELLPEEVGDALQFVEFCIAFEEVLNIKKEQAECIIRELASGRSRNCGQYSSLVRIHIQLLSLIQKNSGIECPSLSQGTSKNSWLVAIRELVPQSQNLLRDIPSDLFEEGVDGYETLSTSQKLKLLNLVCDEALCTDALRVLIDNHNAKFIESGKEARGRVNAVRYKEKELKEKLRNEVTQSLIGQNDDPSSISENDATIAQMKREVDQAHEETLKAVDLSKSKKKQRSDAMRTEPILLEDHGRVFWRLKGHTDEPDVLLQDSGAWDANTPYEKWFSYDAEQKQEIEKYVFSSRKKRVRVSKVKDPPTVGCR